MSGSGFVLARVKHGGDFVVDAVDDPLVSVGAVFFFGFVVLLDHLVQCAHASPKFALDDLIVSPCAGVRF